MTAPTFIRRLRREVQVKLASDTHEARECREALRWLSGQVVAIDFKIETRHRDGVWRHVLMYGSLGYSAASPLVTVEG